MLCMASDPHVERTFGNVQRSFHCHNFNAIDNQEVQVKNAIKHPTMDKMNLPLQNKIKNYQILNLNMLMAENHWSVSSGACQESLGHGTHSLSSLPSFTLLILSRWSYISSLVSVCMIFGFLKTKSIFKNNPLTKVHLEI